MFPFRSGYWPPGDRLRDLSDSAVEYETAANTDGVGIYEAFSPSDLPVRGLIVVFPPWSDGDLIEIGVRLPPKLAAVGDVILKLKEKCLVQDHGNCPWPP